jgi:LmbE family N-acetylglucosaminyl deacetylase
MRPDSVSRLLRMIEAPEPRPDDSCVVLSPHPDDAVLSVWHVLSSAVPARVVTVFAGVPGSGFVTALDRARGAVDSAQLMRKRLTDDRAALAVAGREPAHAPLLDVDYRAYDVPPLRAAIESDPARFIPIVAGAPQLRLSARELWRELDALVDSDLVYASAGIGGHPDHRDVARLGLTLMDEGRTVRFYADSPYFFRHGYPSWLGGAESGPDDEQVEAAFHALVDVSPRLERTVVRLTHAQIDAKLAAIARYETEYDLVNADFGGILEDREAMGHEAYWTLLRA